VGLVDDGRGRTEWVGSVCFGLFVSVRGREVWDEPESLILAQSERWRHA
jgi:hypothetical protein